MKKLIFLFSLLAIVACKNQNTETEEMDMPVEEESMEEVITEADEVAEEMFAAQSSDDQMAANIKNFLMNDYLKNDLANLQEIDRKYQYYSIDMNGDGKDEYFVNFLSPYFCGSGGCTMLLLDHEANVITKFTVMQTPVYVEQGEEGEWRDILVFSEGELKELKYNNGKYPSNPSVLPKAPYDAPSGHAAVMFDDNYAKAKTYTY